MDLRRYEGGCRSGLLDDLLLELSGIRSPWAIGKLRCKNMEYFTEI
jgi:hypothetical protein